MRERDGLAAVLGGGDLCYGLGGNIAGRGKALGLFYHGFAYHCSVLEHVLEIYQTAVVHVLGKVIRIMKVYDAVVMSLNNIGREEETPGDIL